MQRTMQNTIRLGALASTCLLVMPSTIANASEGDANEGFTPSTEWSFELSAGAEFDSNVSVNELDTATGSDDVAIRLRAEADFEAEIAKDTEFKLGYTISDKSFQEFSAFDLRTQIASATLSHDFGPFTAGTTVRYIDAALDDSGYQAVTQFSPYVSGYVAKNVFVRGAYTYADKEFDVQTSRDAEVNTIDLDGYFFLNGSRQYIVLGVEAETSEAVDPQFSFDGQGVLARFSQRFAFRERDARARLSARYESRDYDGITPSINAAREDDRLRLQAEVELPITDLVFIEAEYEYGDFSSNLPTADYAQNVFTVRTGVRF